MPNDRKRVVLWAKEHWHIAGFACACLPHHRDIRNSLIINYLLTTIRVMPTCNAKSELALVRVLVLTASACAPMAGMGVVNCLGGNTLRALASLGVPAFQACWAWAARDNFDSEFLIKICSAAWVACLPTGAASFALRRDFA